VRAEAVVHAGAESVDRRSNHSGDVETVRIVVDSRIAIGCAGVGNDQCACMDNEPGDFDIVEGDTQGLTCYPYDIRSSAVNRVDMGAETR
jgi:hypothetical protein